MTGRERVLAVLAGKQADHLACMPITMMFAADVLGVKYEKYARDHRIMAEAQVKTAEMFGFDHVSTIGPPPPEAADRGAQVQWFADQPPSMIEIGALLEDKSALGRESARGPISGERTENRVRGIELLRQRVGKDLLVEGWASGPCAAAADLRGLSRLMTDFTDDPVFVHELFDFALEEGVRFAAAQIEAGADCIGIGDAAASLVGPRIYRDFVWPREKRLVDAVHERGAKVRIHICGNTRKIVESMGKLGCDIVDVDFLVPIEEARAQTGPQQTLSGNLDPVRDLRNGRPATITSVLECLRRKAGAQWIVSAGCEIVRDTPHENVRALTQFAHTHSAGE
jgi:MtaA/CmuA family methyltransferase